VDERHGAMSREWRDVCAAISRTQGRRCAAKEMALANTKDDTRDALAWYSLQFHDAGMDDSADGIDTLRHIFVLLTGLGMRETSWRYCEGRDNLALNISPICARGLIGLIFI
jgi:hypothetical protein